MISKLFRFLLIAALICFVLYTVIGFVVLPMVAKNLIMSKGSEALEEDVVVGGMSLNPFTGNVSIRDLRVGSEEEPVISVGELIAKSSIFEALKNKEIAMEEITLRRPSIDVVIHEDGTLNLSELSKSPKKPKPEKDDKKGEPPVIRIGLINIEEGAISFLNKRRSHPFKRVISPLNISINDFSTGDGDNRLEFAAVGDDGEKLEIDAAFVVSPFSVEGKVGLTDLPAPAYSGFLGPRMNFEIVDGLISVNGGFKADEAGFSVSDGDVLFQDVILQQDGKSPFAKLPRFHIGGVEVDGATRNVGIKTCKLYEGIIEVERSAGGELNLAGLVKPGPEGSEEKEEAQAPEPSEPIEEKAQVAWNLHFAELGLEQCQVQYEEENKAVIPLDLTLTLEGFSTNGTEPIPLKLDARRKEGEKLVISSKMTMKPAFGLEADVSLTDVSPNDYWGFLDEVLNFQIPEGTIDLKTKLSLQNKVLSMSEGNLELKNLVLQQDDEDPWARIPSLQVSNLSLDMEKALVAMDACTLSKANIKILKRANGKLNVATLTRPKPEEAEQAASVESAEEESSEEGAPKKSWEVRSKRIALEACEVHYLDGPLDFPLTLDASTENFSTTSKAPSQIKLTAKKRDGETLDSLSALQVKPFKITSQVSLTGVDPNDYWHFVEDKLNFEVASGEMDASCVFLWDSKAGGYRVMDGTLSLDQLNLVQGKDENLVDLPSLSVANFSMDSVARKIVLGDLKTSGCMINVKKYEDGSINFAKLLKPKEEDAAPVAEAVEPVAEAVEPAAENAKESKSWDFELGNFHLAESQFQYCEGDVCLLPVGFDLSGENIKTNGEKGKLQFLADLPKGGRLALTDVVFDPLAVTGTGKINMKNLTLDLAKPFVGENILGLDFQVRGIAYSGSFKFNEMAKATRSFSTRGKVGIGQCSIGEPDVEPFVVCEQIDVGEVQYAFPENTYLVSRVDLRGLKALIIRDQQGKLNVVRAFTSEEKKEEASKPSPPLEAKERALLTFDHFGISGGRITFVDQAMSNFTKSVEDLEVNVDDLNLGRETKFNFDLLSSIDHHAPVQAKGRFDSSISKYPNLEYFLIKNVAIKPFSPYTRKYFGRELYGGAISLKSDINVTSSRLDGEMKFLFDRLKVSQKIDTPEMMNVPFGAALFALGKQGKIDETIPISGDPKDPNFDIWPTVGNALSNSVFKIVGAPVDVVTKTGGGILNALTFGAFKKKSQEPLIIRFNRGEESLSPQIRAQIDGLIAQMVNDPFMDLRTSLPKKTDIGLRNQRSGRRVSNIRDYVMSKRPRGQDVKKWGPHRVLGMPPGDFPGDLKEAPNEDVYYLWLERLDRG